MTYKEFYAEQILDLACSGKGIAVDKKTNKPCQCEGMPCHDCALYDKNDGNCGDDFAEWCNAEYVEPCPFKKGEIVEVSDDDIYWNLRPFSKIEDGTYYTIDVQSESIDIPWEYCRKYGTLGGLVKGDENV